MGRIGGGRPPVTCVANRSAPSLARRERRAAFFSSGVIWFSHLLSADASVVCESAAGARRAGERAQARAKRERSASEARAEARPKRERKRERKRKKRERTNEPSQVRLKKKSAELPNHRRPAIPRPRDNFIPALF